MYPDLDFELDLELNSISGLSANARKPQKWGGKTNEERTNGRKDRTDKAIAMSPSNFVNGDRNNTVIPKATSGVTTAQLFIL